MREMKDSGIEWIGEIPKDWEITKIKYYCSSIYAGGTPSSGNHEYWNGDINWIPSGACRDCKINEAPKKITKEGFENSSTKMIPSNNPIMAMTGATCGNTGYLTIDTCANQSVTAYIVNREIGNSLYIWYLLQSMKEHILTYRNGGAQGGINVEDCKNIIVPWIYKEEQNRIANYLDEKCNKIDTVIEKQNTIIEKLKEYKMSIITEAVTKGLNPDAPMKDSGIEWIGKIPKHWRISKVSNFYYITLGKMLQPNKKGEETLENYLCAINLGGNKLSLDIVKQMWFSEVEKEVYKLKKGDLLVVEGGDIASSSILTFEPENLYFQNALHRVRAKKGKNEFLRYWLIFAKNKGYIDMICNKATIPHFTKDKFSSMPIVVIDVNEQIEIIKHIDEISLKVDKFILEKQKIIEKLTEYKKSLIYEVVTGKKEV